MLYILPISALFALCVAWGLLKLIGHFPLLTTKSSIAFIVSLHVAFGIASICYSETLPGSITLVVGLFFMAAVYYFKGRLPFAAFMMKTSVTIVKQHPSTLLLSFLSFITCAVYFVLCAAGS